MPRNRPTYLALVIVIITLGLFSRSSFLPLMMKGGFIATYAGDTLWAAMVYFMVCVAFPKWSALKIAIVALSFCFAIEICLQISETQREVGTISQGQLLFVVGPNGTYLVQ